MNNDKNNQNWDGQLPEQSFQDDKIQVLKRQLTMSNIQKRELVNNDQQFAFTIQKFNIEGSGKIQIQAFHQALVYLHAAEQILEYGASCGKTIDRNLIVTTLHNLACAYQRLWHLEKASSYLQGIIYNLSSYLQHQPEFLFGKTIADTTSKQYVALSTFVKKRKSLAFYYLQFCAVSSQIKKNQEALPAAEKALNLLKSVCRLCYEFEKVSQNQNVNNENNGYPSTSNSVKKSFKGNHQPNILRSLSKISYNINLAEYPKVLNDTKKKMHRFKAKISNQDKLPGHLIQELKQFSIASLMQLNSIVVENNSMASIKSEISQIKKIYEALYMSINFFTMATECRLMANKKYHMDQTMKRESEEFKKSQIYHLMSLNITLTYVPCETAYLKHTLKTFNTHFRIDFNKIEPMEEFSDSEQELLTSSQEIGGYSKIDSKQSNLHSNIIKKSAEYSERTIIVNTNSNQEENINSLIERISQHNSDKNQINSDKGYRYETTKVNTFTVNQPEQQRHPNLKQVQKKVLKKKQGKQKIQPYTTKKHRNGNTKKKLQQGLKIEGEQIGKKEFDIAKTYRNASRSIRSRNGSKSKNTQYFVNRLTTVTSADRLHKQNTDRIHKESTDRLHKESTNQHKKSIVEHKRKQKLKTEAEYLMYPREQKLKQRQTIFSPRSRHLLSQSSKRSSIAKSSLSKDSDKKVKFVKGLKSPKAKLEDGKKKNTKTSRQYSGI